MNPTPQDAKLWQRPATGQLFATALESQTSGAAAPAQPPVTRLSVPMISVWSPWLRRLDD